MFPFGSHHNIHKCTMYYKRIYSYGFSANFFVCCRTPVGEEEKVRSRPVLSTFLFLRTFWLATRGHEVVFSAASWWSSKMDEEAEKKEDSAFVSRVHLGLPKNEVRFEWLRQKISYLEGLNSFGISFPEMVSCSYHDIKTSQQYRVHISEISRCSSALLIYIFGQKMPKKTKKILKNAANLYIDFLAAQANKFCERVCTALAIAIHQSSVCSACLWDVPAVPLSHANISLSFSDPLAARLC